MTIVEAFSTRSIIRGTALKGVADVDVICALHYGKHIKNKTPQQVLESVREALSEYNAQIIKKNGQCVTLYFKSWPNVGIVSACQVANNNVITRYELPDANSGNWIPSNPKLHDAPIAKRNQRSRERIQMIKCWNGAHSEYLQSFHIETMELFTSEPSTFVVSGDARAWEVFQFFDQVVPMIAGALKHPNGASPDVSEYLSVQDRKEAKNRLEAARDNARTAWVYTLSDYRNEKKSIEIYRTIFGDKFPAYG